MKQDNSQFKNSTAAENGTSKPKKGADQLPLLFREKFLDTWGHPIQRGQLQTTLKQAGGQFQ